MYIDAVTIAALTAEFNETLLGGRVQKVVQVDEMSVGMEIYANHHRHYLLISARSDAARCLRVSDRLRRGTEKPSPLMLLLRKYVDGARLNAITQPPWERILWFDFDGEEGDTRLIAEIMDRRSNLILTDHESRVMEAIKRVGADRNRYRVTLPGQPYVPPPPQNKIAPDAVTAPMISEFLQKSADTPAWRVLVNNLAGCSPLFAREVVFRAGEDAEAPAFDLDPSYLYAALFDAVEDINNHRWWPTLVPGEEPDTYRAFAAYKLTHMAGWQPASTISDAVRAYIAAPTTFDAYAPAKKTVEGQIEEALTRLNKKLAAMERQSVPENEIEVLRKKGELLLAYGPTLEDGQAEFSAQYDFDAPPLTIRLDPTLTYVKNSQVYFARYEKARRAQDELPRLIRGTRREVAYVEQLQSDLALAESWPEIEEVRAALQEAGYWQGRKTRGPGGGKPGIRRFTTAEGFVIMVGRNAAQNHVLVTERSNRADLWLHARNVPGSHVIIRNDGRPIPGAVIEGAAALAAYYSSRREDGTVEVDVTERRYVRPIKGGKPGMVTYKNESTLTVVPSHQL